MRFLTTRQTRYDAMEKFLTGDLALFGVELKSHNLSPPDRGSEHIALGSNRADVRLRARVSERMIEIEGLPGALPQQRVGAWNFDLVPADVPALLAHYRQHHPGNES